MIIIRSHQTESMQQHCRLQAGSVEQNAIVAVYACEPIEVCQGL